MGFLNPIIFSICLASFDKIAYAKFSLFKINKFSKFESFYTYYMNSYMLLIF